MALIELDCELHEIPRASVFSQFWASARQEVAAAAFADDVAGQVKGTTENPEFDDAFSKDIARLVTHKANAYVVQQRQLKQKP